MIKYVKKHWKEKSIEWLFFGILAFQLVIWAYLNLCKVPQAMDDDLAKLMRHAIEMWKNRTFFIKDWVYFTTGEQDCAAFLGMLFYTFTHDICLAFGMANIVNIALFAWTVHILLCNAQVPRIYRLLALILVLIPYSFGQLNYNNMLFYAGAQYIYKVLLPLMYVAVLYLPIEKRKKPASIALLIIFFVLLWVNALSSGIYVLACGFLPVMVCGITKWLARTKEERRGSLFCIGVSLCSVLVFLSGTMIAERNGLDAKGNSLFLMQSGVMMDGIRNFFRSFLMVLDILPWWDVSALSVAGLSYVFKVLILLGICYFGFGKSGSFLNLKELFHGTRTETTEGKSWEIKTILLSVFIWNAAIMLLTQCNSRYFLIGFIPLMISAAIGVCECMHNNCHVLFRNLFLVFLGAVVLYESGYSIACAGERYYLDNKDVPALSEYFQAQGYENVFFCDDSGTVEKLRVLDDGILYVVYYPDERQTFVIDYYRNGAEASSYVGRNALVIPDDVDGSRIPEYISSIYVEKDRIGKFVIYESEENRFDGETGLEFGSYAIDYPYVDGYDYKGEINRDGLLLTYGVDGYALESPVYVNEKRKSYAVTMHYYAGSYTGIVGAVELWCAGSLLETQELSADSNEVQFVVDGIQNCQIKVKVDSDKSIAVEKFDFKELE